MALTPYFRKSLHGAIKKFKTDGPLAPFLLQNAAEQLWSPDTVWKKGQTFKLRINSLGEFTERATINTSFKAATVLGAMGGDEYEGTLDTVITRDFLVPNEIQAAEGADFEAWLNKAVIPQFNLELMIKLKSMLHAKIATGTFAESVVAPTAIEFSSINELISIITDKNIDVENALITLDKTSYDALLNSGIQITNVTASDEYYKTGQVSIVSGVRIVRGTQKELAAAKTAKASFYGDIVVPNALGFVVVPAPKLMGEDKDALVDQVTDANGFGFKFKMKFSDEKEGTILACEALVGLFEADPDLAIKLVSVATP